MNKETIYEKHLQIHRENSIGAAGEHTDVTIQAVIDEVEMVDKLLRELGVTPVAIIKIQARIKQLKELL